MKFINGTPELEARAAAELLQQAAQASEACWTTSYFAAYY